MKILLLGWNRRKMINWNYELFREELARQHEVIFFGSGYEGYNSELDVSSVLKQNPGTDFILVHIEHRDGRLTPGLENIKNIFRVHICGDYYEYKQSVIDSYNTHFQKINYDVIFARDNLELRALEKNNIRGKHYIQLLYADTHKFRKLHVKKSIDVMATLRSHITAHPGRKELGRRISAMNVSSFLEIAWFDEYVRKINQSRIFATSNIKHGFLTAKYFEVLACGTFMLATKPNSKDWKRSGLKNGKHLVFCKDDFSDLEDKIKYFLKHGKEREEIAANGMNFVRKKHSTEIRVIEFSQIVKRELKKRS